MTDPVSRQTQAAAWRFAKPIRSSLFNPRTWPLTGPTGGFLMKPLAFFAVLLVLAQVAAAKPKVLTADPLTGLPLFPATDSGFGNEPSPMPSSNLCGSKMQAEFYLLAKTKVSATVAWYGSHLAGFKKIEGYADGRSQTIFSNAGGTTLVIVTGSSGAKGEDADAYSVAYQRYQPGL